MAGIFNSVVFNNAIFNTGAAPAPSQDVIRNFSLKNWRRWVRKEEEIEEEAAVVIEAVALRQAEALPHDAQQRFEELERELILAGVEWDTRYLEALNTLRERLIEEEIGKRLRIKQQNEQTLIAMMLLIT